MFDPLPVPVDPRLLAAISKVKKKRPRVVLDHILSHGYITTEELEGYGYKHPPRAAGDVRDAGIPLETYRIHNKDGRLIGAYKLGDPANVQDHKLAGRRTFSKDLHDRLANANRSRCYVCMTEYEARYLQIDHRVPYRVAGEPAGEDQSSGFMLLCASCQRKKSWSCEKCPNWTVQDRAVCESCFWAHPDDYRHVETRPERRVELVFSGSEAALYDDLKSAADSAGTTLETLLKYRLTR